MLFISYVKTSSQLEQLWYDIYSFWGDELSSLPPSLPYTNTVLHMVTTHWTVFLHIFLVPGYKKIRSNMSLSGLSLFPCIFSAMLFVPPGKRPRCFLFKFIHHNNLILHLVSQYVINILWYIQWKWSNLIVFIISLSSHFPLIHMYSYPLKLYFERKG